MELRLGSDHQQWRVTWVAGAAACCFEYIYKWLWRVTCFRLELGQGGIDRFVRVLLLLLLGESQSQGERRGSACFVTMKAKAHYTWVSIDGGLCTDPRSIKFKESQIALQKTP